MTSPGYLRFPHARGDMLAFTADDDVWLVPVAGGQAWRVSSDHALVSYPRLSGDGAYLAWTSACDGAPEVRLCELASGRTRRLTYWGTPGTRMAGWTPDGEVVALTSAGQSSDTPPWAQVVPLTGGASRCQPFGPVADVSMERAGTALLSGTWGRDPAYWKRYRGGTAGRLWIRPSGEEEFTRVLADLRGHFASPMVAGGRLVFLSDHEGTGNLYSCRFDGSDLRRHTDHDGFYARHASTDGERVVYECAGELWLLADLEASPRRLEVTLGPAAPPPAPRFVSAADRLDDVSCDETGRASAVEVQGTVHWLTHRDGPARALSVAPDARARLPRVLGTSGQVVWVTDAGGQDALEVALADGPATGGPATDGPGTGAPATGGGAPRRLAAGQLGLVTGLAAAPDGSTVAVASRDGRLQVVDIETGAVTPLAESDDGPVTGLSYSPDSAWLAWSQPGPRPLSRIRLARLAAAQVVDVTDGRFSDFEPVFTGDGRYLAFLSRRSFDPVYDTHSFDLAFPAGCRPYLVTLAAGTPSPFGPLVGGRPVTDDDKDSGKEHAPQDGDGPGTAAHSRATAGPAGRSAGPAYPAAGAPHGESSGGESPEPGDAAAASAGAAPGEAARSGSTGGEGQASADETAGGDGGEDGAGGEHRPPPVRVDIEGLPGRLVPVPVEDSRYESLRAVTGGLAWLKNMVTGVLGEGGPDPDGDSPRPCLERFDLRQRNCAEVVAELDWFEVSGDGNWLLVHDHGGLRVTSAERKGGEGPDPVRVDLSRARFLADPVAQWHHAFDEAGRAMRHDFWVADMAGVDWDAVLASYRPLVSRIRTADDFTDLMWEVCGELGSSHAYVRPAPPGHRPSSLPAPGFLGADLEQDGDGNWRVARVLPGESSDPRARSPLAEPGVAVEPGSRLAAVDGQPVDPAAGPAPLLSGAAGKPVELTVVTPAGRRRRVAVVPLASERRLRYQDWVAGNRRKVRELTGGQGGYLHVPDMTGEGWAHFHRDLRAEMARDLLILDVRDNRGGHTSELVVEKLARRVIGWDLPRSMRPETYPRDAPRGPVVALADELAGSDGDVITAAIRTLGLGPVVGARTWGGVIGIDDGFTLVDGTTITVPKYALWFEDQGWSVENHGVDPDVEVLITPADWAQGRDPQLDTAVRLGLEALRERPAVRPPDTATRPSRRRSPLPGRPGA